MRNDLTLLTFWIRVALMHSALNSSVNSLRWCFTLIWCSKPFSTSKSKRLSIHNEHLTRTVISMRWISIVLEERILTCCSAIFVYISNYHFKILKYQCACPNIMHCALNYTANPVKIDLHKYISDNRQLRISAGACVAITLRKEVALSVSLTTQQTIVSLY